jgi:hypothetical protein
VLKKEKKKEYAGKKNLDEETKIEKKEEMKKFDSRLYGVSLARKKPTTPKETITTT